MRTMKAKRYMNSSAPQMRAQDSPALKRSNIINLSLGDPDVTTDERIIRQAFDDALQGHTHYTEFLGQQELREEIVNFYRDDYDMNIQLEQVMITTSGSHGMWLLLESMLDEGDEVMIPNPCFAPYVGQIQLAGGVPVAIPTFEEKGFVMQVEDIETRLTERTKIIIVNTPHNPTGACYSEEDLQKILDLAEAHDLFLIADDIYSFFQYDGEFIPLSKLDISGKRVVTINSFSKTFAMTGWRIGVIIAPTELIQVTQNINENCVFTAPSISQRAALHAMRMREQVAPAFIQEIRERIDVALERISSIPKMHCSKPKGGMYVFINIKDTGKSSREVASILLEEASLITLPGSNFGSCGEGYIRLAMTVSKDVLHEAFDRIEALPLFNKK